MNTDVVIIGAGVVGLACAAETASKKLATLVLERHASFGQETSSHNSEVIHSGIYYPTSSFKARLCVPANRALYDYCEREGVWTRRCGKLVVAVSDEEVPQLEAIHTNGTGNGVDGLRMLDAREARSLEPNIACVAALHVPSTGLVDSHELLRSYLRRATSNAADIVYNTSMEGAERAPGGYKLRVREEGGESTNIGCRYVVNAAGNASDDVAAMFGIDVDAAGYRIHHNRGHYYRVAHARGALVSRLIYPVPPVKFTSIGIHITLDRGGQVKLGPDAEYIDPEIPESEWYRFDDNRRGMFHESVVRYFPALQLEDLSPDQVGIRAKIQKPGELAKDFIINEESARGLPGLVNLIGIESPGLTCSAEIAKMVSNLITG